MDLTFEERVRHPPADPVFPGPHADPPRPVEWPDLRDDRATCYVYSQTVSGHLTVLHGAPLAEPVMDTGGA